MKANEWKRTSSGHRCQICFLPVLAVVGALLAAPMMSEGQAGPRTGGVLAAGGQEVAGATHGQRAGGPPPSLRQASGRAPHLASQKPDDGKRESKAQPGSANSLLVEKAPLSAIVRCVTTTLEERGWNVLPLKADKKQLLALRNVEADELRRIADTKRGQSEIHWVQGRVHLVLSFSPANDQQTRIVIKARILGQGEASLPVLRPSNLWTLPSTGALEGDVLAALRVCCGPATKSRRTQSR